MILPARHEQDFIADALESLRPAIERLRTIGVDVEVLVSDSSNDDLTREAAIAAGRESWVRVVQHSLNGAGAARNFGASHATGDVFLFVDSDARPEMEAVVATYFLVAFGGIDLATVDMAPIAPALWWEPAIYRLLNIYFRQYERTSSPACCGFFLATSRSAFERVAGFDERRLLAEDHDYARRCKRSGGSFVWLGGLQVFVSSRRFKDRPLGPRLKDLRGYLASEVARLLTWRSGTSGRVP